uniref:Uncharacterized protein n=1 Tax=Anguilla anguilla TaxID=7936 RepID=A0A0E9V0X9_ANGAN
MPFLMYDMKVHYFFWIMLSSVQYI